MRITFVASSLITATELLALLGSEDLRVIDTRFELTQPDEGRRLYREGHVPGAVYLDLDDDLSDLGRTGAGRHPLPDMTTFAAKLGALGIDRESKVVIYDQSGGMYAARAWWLLRYAGHENVRVLDGGFEAYRRAGGSLATEPPTPTPTTFELDVRSDMAITADELESRLGDAGLAVLDARAPERYRGDVEPLDKVAGHIPTAINLPYTLALAGGTMLPREALKAAFAEAELGSADEVVAYCGSGVSAAHLVLSLERAGVSGVRLYPGSWSEWSSREDLPVASGPEPGAVDG